VVVDIIVDSGHICLLRFLCSTDRENCGTWSLSLCFSVALSFSVVVASFIL
jgi:hypothetical protein